MPGGLLVGGGPGGTGRRSVVDPQPGPDRGQPVADPFDPFGEGAVEDDRHRVGVLPQVDELVVGVPVVGVDRHQADLEAGEGGLEVLRAVVEVDGHLVLVADPGVEEPPGQVVGPAVQLTPGQGGVPMGEGGCVGQHVGHRLPDVSEVPRAHLCIPSSIPRADPRTGSAYAGLRGLRTAGRGRSRAGGRCAGGWRRTRSRRPGSWPSAAWSLRTGPRRGGSVPIPPTS